MDETETSTIAKIPVIEIGKVEPYSTHEVLVNGQELGEGIWDSLTTDSLKEGLEKGVVVSKRDGKIATGTIYTGSEDKIYPPSELFKGKGLDKVFVHTHLVEVFADGEEGITSTLPSQKDVQEFFKRKGFNAFVILDAGGKGTVHLLIRGSLGTGIVEVPDGFVRNHFARELAGQEAVNETMINLAQDLSGLGILYYVNKGRQKQSNLLHFKSPRRATG